MSLAISPTLLTLRTSSVAKNTSIFRAQPSNTSPGNYVNVGSAPTPSRTCVNTGTSVPVQTYVNVNTPAAPQAANVYAKTPATSHITNVYAKTPAANAHGYRQGAPAQDLRLSSDKAHNNYDGIHARKLNAFQTLGEMRSAQESTITTDHGNKRARVNTIKQRACTEVSRRFVRTSPLRQREIARASHVFGHSSAATRLGTQTEGVELSEQGKTHPCCHKHGPPRSITRTHWF